MAFEHKYCDSCWSPYNLQKVEEETERYICETCLKHEVNEANMMPILKRVLVYLEAFGFDDIQMDSITIHIISKAEMQQRYGSAAGLHCGYSTICNEKGRADFHQDIYILDHYNEIRFAGTLAHELIHAWQLEQNISDFNKYDEDDSYRKKCEGFANIGAYVVYKQIYKETRSEIAKRYIEQMKVEPDEAYGVSFRKIWERCKKVGRHQIIKEARMNKIQL